MTTLTLQYPAHTSKGGYAPLKNACLSTAFLYNLIIQQRNYASTSHRHRYTRRLTSQNITELSNNQPLFQPFALKLLQEVEKDAHRAFNAFFTYLSDRKQDIPTQKVGRPKQKDTNRRRTLTVSEPSVHHLIIRNQDNRQLNFQEPSITWEERENATPKPKARHQHQRPAPGLVQTRPPYPQRKAAPGNPHYPLSQTPPSQPRLRHREALAQTNPRLHRNRPRDRILPHHLRQQWRHRPSPQPQRHGTP